MMDRFLFLFFLNASFLNLGFLIYAVERFLPLESSKRLRVLFLGVS